jgi:hypothetical protein
MAPPIHPILEKVPEGAGDAVVAGIPLPEARPRRPPKRVAINPVAAAAPIHPMG